MDQTPIITMLASLAGLYAAEGRPGGEETARAIVASLSQPTHVPTRTNPLTAVAEQALAIHPHPLADLIHPALPLIDWHHSGYDDGRIRPDISLKMLTAQLVGPDGMFFHPTVSMGLFVQAAGLDYVTRKHMAEETFIMLGGVGWWSTHDGPGEERRSGAVIHHPSMIPHASVTRDHPLIATWRWTGDIAWEGYHLTG